MFYHVIEEFIQCPMRGKIGLLAYRLFWILDRTKLFKTSYRLGVHNDGNDILTRPDGGKISFNRQFFDVFPQKPLVRLWVFSLSLFV